MTWSKKSTKSSVGDERGGPMVNSLPFCRLLAPRDVKQIDKAGRGILESVGVKIRGNDTLAFLDTFSNAGAGVDYDTQTVRFGGEFLDEVLSRAPSRFTLYSRDGRNDLDLGEGNVYFGNGGRAFRVLDMASGGYRLTMLRDVANTAAIVDHLEHLRFYIIACQAHDIKPVNYHLLDFFHALNHTKKHVMGGCTDVHGAEQVYKLGCIIAGGERKFKKKPIISVITNMICPLTVETNTLDILKFCTSNGIPVTCATAPIAGATAPATLAGALSQMHAEALAGVAITQILTPGAKVLYGAVPTTMDLRNMEFAMGSVEMGMMNAAAVQLAKVCGLPIYASGGVTEAKRPDIQAGFEKAISNLTVAMSGADFIHLAAGMIDSANSISYEQYLMDNEIIGMIYRVLSGINVNKETMALDVIESVGPGGNFVTEDHTIDHMMDEFFYPSLGIRCNFDIWEEKDRPYMLSRAKVRVQDILDGGREGLLDLDLISEIEATFPNSRSL